MSRWALAASSYGGQGPLSITAGQVSPSRGLPDKLDDQDFPAHTIGLAAELLGLQPAFYPAWRPPGCPGRPHN